MRRRMRGNQKEMKIGNKQDAKTRHMLPNGFKKLLISCEKDAELLLMNNGTYCGEIAQGISVAKRLRIVQRCKELNVRLTNAQAKSKKESTE
jgi:large subunit ribosomal protein L32e